MTTTEALDTKTETVNYLVRDAIEDANRALDIAEKSKVILMLLPEDVLQHANASSGYIQLSNLSREEATQAISALHAGRWDKKISICGDDKIDYEATISGVRVVICAAQPPSSCRIIEETEEVPAHTITKRKLICAPDKPVADCLALAKAVAATDNNE